MIHGDGAISLRTPRPGDRDRWFELMLDRDELRYGLPAFVSPPAGVEAVDRRIEEARQRLAEVQPGTLTVVAGGDPDAFLGMISWRQDHGPQFGIADIGYAVHPDARGRGVARAAIAILTRWLMYDETGPAQLRVQLDHSVENPASCRAASAAGLAKEGIRRGYLPLRDAAAPGGVRRHDVCLHGIIA